MNKFFREVRDDPEALALWREAMKEQGHNQYTSKVDNVNLAPKGNSRSYTLSRLKKDHPKLFEQVKAKPSSETSA